MNYIEWDIAPSLHIGSFELRYYSLLFMLAFLSGLAVTKKIYVREHIALEKLDKLLIYTVIATLLGARLGHVIFYDWAYYQKNLLEILLPFRFKGGISFTGFSGLASHGATIGILIGHYIYSKRYLNGKFLWLLDRFTIPASLGAVFVRFGNLMNSEIVGSPTDVPWAFIFMRYRDHLPRHPAQIYEALGYLSLFIVLSLLYWKGGLAKKTGFLFGLFMTLLFSFRLFIEQFKENQVAFESSMTLNMGQWLSIPFILLGATLIIRSFLKPPKK